MSLYSAEALERGLKLTLLNRMANETQVLVDRLCEVVPSDGDDEKHEWLGDPPQMEEFKGARKSKAPTSTGHTIENKVYDAAVDVRRDDIRRNRSGSIMRQINKLADVAMSFPNKRVTELMTAGTTDLCYDGTAMIGDSHPARADEGGTQDNLLAGTGVTTAAFQTDIASAVAAFANFLAENGEPFFGDLELDLHIECPPALLFKMREAVEATVISQTTNVNAGISTVRANSRLTATDANDWYMFVTNPGYRPFIWQPEQAAPETDVTAEGSDQWKNQRKATFGVSQALGAGNGFWQSVIKTTNA